MSFILRRTQITMKKSKIIVPALGLLLLSTAASISGSVAWFTANRTFNADIGGKFAVVATTGDLACTFTPGVGTENALDGNNQADPSTLKISTGAVLADASLNHKTKTVVFPTNDKATTFDEYVVTGTKGDSTSGDTKNLTRAAGANNTTIYSAFTWKMTFTFTTSNESDSYALFFDLDANKSDVAYTATTLDTGTGFRMAFINIGDNASNTGARKVVWADNQVINNCKYVASKTAAESDNTGTTYTASDKDLIASNTASTVSGSIATINGNGGIADNDSGMEGYYNYFGKFVPGARTITFLCVAWFEGTDGNIQEGHTLDEVSAKLYFETRKMPSAS